MLEAVVASDRVVDVPLACSWYTNGLDAGWVRVAGELDIATSPQLRQTLREAQRPLWLVVLDLREVTFMDSSGVHIIADAAIDAKRTGGRLLVVRGPAQVDRLLTLTGADRQVLIFDLDVPEPGPMLRLVPSSPQP
jgi:anti-sigma B factor antagonist